MRNNCLIPLNECIQEAKSDDGFPEDLIILLGNFSQNVRLCRSIPTYNPEFPKPLKKNNMEIEKKNTQKHGCCLITW